MANGITRLYKAIWYTQVGRVLEQADRIIENLEVMSETYYEDIFHDTQENTQSCEQSDRLIENPESVREAYDELIRDKQGNIQRYKEAIGQLIALVEQKKNSLKGLSDDIDKLEHLKTGAIEKMESVAAELQKVGTSDEEIEQDLAHVRCVTAYKDFHITVEEKNARVGKLEQDIARAQNDIESHKLQITKLLRDLDKIKDEQSDAIADIIAAREQEDIDDMLSGIRTDDNS